MDSGDGCLTIVHRTKVIPIWDVAYLRIRRIIRLYQQTQRTKYVEVDLEQAPDLRMHIVTKAPFVRKTYRRAALRGFA